MPVDVLEVPSTYTHFRNEQCPIQIPRGPNSFIKPVSPDAKPEQGKAILYWREVQSAVDFAMRKLHKENPGLSHKVDLIGDLLFGPFRLMPETLVSTNNDYEKEASAKIQHNIAHNIIFASEGRASVPYCDNLYDILAMQNNITDSPVGNVLKLKYFWSGVKNEVGSIKALLKEGYSIWIPDYSEDPEEDDVSDEVMQWDVKKGIDFIAQKDGKMLLVDSKGRSSRSVNDRIVKNTEVDVQPREYYKHPKLNATAQLPLTIQELIQEQQPHTVQKLTIVLPSANLGRIGYRTVTQNSRNQLRMYGALPDHNRRELKMKLDRIP